MNWKSALAGSALALSAQAGMAAKPLPCPMSSPLVDTVGIVQNDTKQRIVNRLQTIDSTKHHQVVVITVNWLAEYGYGSIEEMANAIGTSCKVGYRGEDTGVVVLYTKIPSRYRIETAKTERYITDVESGRILAHSKSNGVCLKEDASCRLDDVTLQIERLITKQFPDTASLLPLKNEIVRHDEIKSAKQTSDLLNQLGIGAVLVVVLWGVGYGGTLGILTLRKNQRRKLIKKKIFELNAELLLEKQKYPDWFLNQFTHDIEKTIEGMFRYSDEEIDQIIVSQRKSNLLDKDIDSIRNTIRSWPKDFSTINNMLEKAKVEVQEETDRITVLKQNLDHQGFKFSAIHIPTFPIWDTSGEIFLTVLWVLKTLKESREALENIPKFYDSLRNRIDGMSSEFNKLKADYIKYVIPYKEAFGQVPDIAINDLEKEMVKFVADFRKAYLNKDIPLLRIFVERSKHLSRPLSDALNMMVDELNWYTSIPFQIKTRREKIQWVTIQSRFEIDALEYAKKTWKRTFSNYKMGIAIENLWWILDSITHDYSQKKDLKSIPLRISKFDMEYQTLEEYMGLGATLAIFITEEALALKKKKLEQERRKKQEEDDEERRKRREEEDRQAYNRNSSDDHSSNWSSGGGGGFSGGGATSD